MDPSAEPAPTDIGPDAGGASPADLEMLVRRLLELLGRITGLHSTYLTAIDSDNDVQEILYARNVGSIEIPEGLRVDWSDTLCRRALDGGPACTTDVAAIYPDSAAARELGIKTYVTVAVRAPDGAVFGTLCGADSRGVDVSADAFALMETLAEMVALQLVNEAARRELAAANHSLAQLSFVDGLTGVGNRRALDRDLAGACARAVRRGAPIAVVAVDVDRFKAINDSLGHAAGDEVLQEISRRLVHQSRTGDFVARLGGDEFVAVLVDADIDVARGAAERLCFDVAGQPIMTARGPVTVTISVGVAGGSDVDPQALLRQADIALYAAKDSGRNGVRILEIDHDLRAPEPPLCLSVARSQNDEPATSVRRG